MTKIITIHSFRRGAGKSNLVANLAALLAAEGYRVGVGDSDFQAPSLHLFFNMPENDITSSLNDYLWGTIELMPTIYDVTSHLGADMRGSVSLIPASPRTADIMRILRSSYDFERFSDGFQQVVETARLDYLLLDTAAGLNEDTLQSIAIANTLILLLRPDPQDFQGTAVTVEVARSLEVQRLLLVLNDAPDNLDIPQAKNQLEQTYSCDVAAVLPHSDALLTLGSSGLFVLQYPNDPLTAQLKQLARLIA